MPPLGVFWLHARLDDFQSLPHRDSVQWVGSSHVHIIFANAPAGYLGQMHPVDLSLTQPVIGRHLTLTPSWRVVTLARSPQTSPTTYVRIVPTSESSHGGGAFG